ncbi:hypothetical protein [Pimelobacter simplex]|uniref:hypothetical protein n=1 Tax=Nocardioides simplex TaxID=2045 RepID=UPI003AAC9F9E
MDDEIQLISDGDGLAVIGDPTEVERFLVSEGLPSRDLGLDRLGSGFGTALGAGAGLAQAGSQLAAGSGRWVQLTEKSAKNIKRYGLRESSTSGLSTGVIKGPKGQVKGFVEFARSPKAALTNPAALAGAAGIMAQLAMQQAMDEITDYLATIDQKVDDVLRAQKDAVLADMIGVDLVIEEAMTIRDEVGRVSEVTWSKVQACSATIARTQAYALRQLDALAERLESQDDLGDLAKTAREAEAKVVDWLSVLARCFQLQDAIAVLELDRVLDSSADELDRHRIGLRTARRNRMQLIARSTERLVTRMDAAAGQANAKVLLHPSKSPAVVRATNEVLSGVDEFHARLGIASGSASAQTRRWAEAAADARDRALASGADGVGAARRLGARTRSRAGTVGGKVTQGIAQRARRRPADDEASETDD